MQIKQKPDSFVKKKLNLDNLFQSFNTYNVKVHNQYKK